jgi:hypothetical protein
LVLENYPKNKIAIVDGEDDIMLVDNINIPYFKRELVYNNLPNVYPISFSIPEEKIIKDTSNIKKTKMLADYIPNSCSGSGYIYNTEEDYYNNYREAFFGFTCKKGGWDCMRHYEILANYCLPRFIHLEHCPTKTMKNFPKTLVREGTSIYDKNQITDRYYEILNQVFDYTKKELTTVVSAKYVLDTLKSLE